MQAEEAFRGAMRKEMEPLTRSSWWCVTRPEQEHAESKWLRKEDCRQFIWGGGIWKEQVSHFLECDFFKL